MLQLVYLLIHTLFSYLYTLETRFTVKFSQVTTKTNGITPFFQLSTRSAQTTRLPGMAVSEYQVKTFSSYYSIPSPKNRYLNLL